MTRFRQFQKYIYLLHDLLCICAALMVALYLRNGFPLIQEGKPEDIYLLLGMTFVCGLVVLPLMHTHTSMWRYTSSSEMFNLMIAVALVIVICNSALFITSRLEMVPRSVPPIHWALAIVAMGASRLAARRIAGPARELASKNSKLKQHVLVVGACYTAELYLRFIKRIVQHEVVVEGILDSDATLTGRMFQNYKILGTIQQLPELLEKLNLHGIHVKHIVLARLFEELSNDEKKLLIELKKSKLVDLIHFGKHMGAPLQSPLQATNGYYEKLSTLPEHSYEAPRGVYPYIKRLLDLLLASSLLLFFFPLICLTALLVLVDVGRPVFFWQQRPGRFGKPFRLYKFRTMRDAGRKMDQDRHSHKKGDEARTSLIGKTLRKLRLDELPQLMQILLGTMSFIGPRPLLPDDQPSEGELRLSVRPGVTGLAQIHGGDALSPADKLLLDVWYIRHLSLWLDVSILLRTFLVVLRPDTRKSEAIERIRQLARKESTSHEPV